MNADEPCATRRVSLGHRRRLGRERGARTLVIDSLVETLVMILSVKPTSASSAGTKQPARARSTSAPGHLARAHVVVDDVTTTAERAGKGKEGERTDVGHERDERDLL